MFVQEIASSKKQGQMSLVPEIALPGTLIWVNAT